MRFSKSSGSSSRNIWNRKGSPVFLGCFRPKFCRRWVYPIHQTQHLISLSTAPKCLMRLNENFVSSLSLTTCNSKISVLCSSQYSATTFMSSVSFCKIPPFTHIYKDKFIDAELRNVGNFNSAFWFLIGNFVILVFLVLRTINNLYV